YTTLFRSTKTKGGIKRDIHLNPGDVLTFRDVVANAQQEKIFIEHGSTHKQAMKSIQNLIHNHREVFTEDGISNNKDQQYKKDLNIDYERKNLTFHGLR